MLDVVLVDGTREDKVFRESLGENGQAVIPAHFTAQRTRVVAENARDNHPRGGNGSAPIASNHADLHVTSPRRCFDNAGAHRYNSVSLRGAYTTAGVSGQRMFVASSGRVFLQTSLLIILYREFDELSRGSGAFLIMSEGKHEATHSRR
jgi:hypothetical protein